MAIARGEGAGAFGDWSDFGEADHFRLRDLDGDGHVDLITGIWNGVSVWRGRGDGTFELRSSHPSMYALQQLAVGDFNANGRPDIAYVDGREAREVELTLLEVGRDFSFIEVGSSALSRSPSVLEAGPLLRDGFDAILLLDSAGLEIRRGLDLIGSATTAAEATRLVVVDIDLDGANDLVIGGSSRRSGLQVLLGDGHGGLRPSNAALSRGTPLAVADIDADGDPDVLAWVPSFDQVSSISPYAFVLLNRDGELHATTPFYLRGNVHGIAAADLDGNGATDLLISTRTGAQSELVTYLAHP